LVLTLIGVLISQASRRSRRPWANPQRGVPNPGHIQLRQFPGHQEGIAAVAVTPDGLRALSGAFDRTLRLWDLDNGQELRRFEGHTEPVLSVAVSPDGRRALSASLDKTVRLWDVHSGQELRRFDGFPTGVTGVAFSPDGKRFAASYGFEQVKHTLKNDAGPAPLENLEWRRAQVVPGGRRGCE